MNIVLSVSIALWIYYLGGFFFPLFFFFFFLHHRNAFCASGKNRYSLLHNSKILYITSTDSFGATKTRKKK